MTTVEDKILSFIKKNLYVFLYIGITTLALFVRYCLRERLSGDLVNCLIPWYDEIKTNGRLLGLNQQVGNYNMLYQFVIALFTYLPIKPVYAYKIFSAIFDFGLAVLCSMIVWCETKEVKYGILAYTCVLFAPTVFINSSSWGQCDAIFTFWAILAAHDLIRGKNIRNFIWLGLAFAFKLQTVFVLPFWIFIYVFHNAKGKKGISIFHFLIIPAVMWVSGIPCYIMGRKDLLSVFKIYMEQTDTFHEIIIDYPSFWSLLMAKNSSWDYYMMKNVAIIFTVMVLGLMMLNFRDTVINRKNAYYILFIMAYACVYFLPSMHERYGYIYEILAILICFIDKKTIPACIGLEIISIFTYGNSLYENNASMQLLALANMAILIYYFVRANKFTTDNCRLKVEKQ